MDITHELIIPNDNYPFKIIMLDEEDGNYRIARHWHRSVEILTVIEGQVELLIEAKRYFLKSGEFVIINSNEVHAINAVIPNKTLVLQIPPDAFGDCFNELYMIFPQKADKHGQKLVEMMLEIYVMYRKKEFAGELKIKGSFYFMLYHLLTNFKIKRLGEEVSKQRRDRDRLTPITDYMKAHYQEELSLASVAEKFSYSPTYLSRIFKKNVDINFQTYLTDIRVEHAVRDLTKTNYEIGDIAVFHGFSDGRAFTKAFIKRYECLPSEFRKKLL